MRDVIPSPVFERIHDFLESAGNRAEEGWESGSAQEEALTGHLGATLQRTWSHWFRVGSKAWRWRIRYKVFGSGGKFSEESLLGADGLIQIEVSLADGSLVTKGIIFQAKKRDLRDRRLPGQVEKMEEIARDASCVVVYGGQGYTALSGSALARQVGESGSFSRDFMGQPLGTYLANEFLPCNTGQRGLYFDAHRKVLTLPASDRASAVRAILGDRLTIEVQASSLGTVRGAA